MAKLRNFNSIKVQLELIYSPFARCQSLFQFHKGTIRTFAPRRALLDDILFQFHKGTIRTEERLPFLLTKRNFNSIKVQLEPTPSAVATSCKPYFNSIKVQLELQADNRGAEGHEFQFHKGTIRTLFCSRRDTFNGISIP